MECETNCLNERRFEVIEKELKDLKEKRSRDNRDFYDRIEILEKENALLKKDIEYIKETTEEMNENIKTLMATPGKRYETIIACVLTTIVGTLIGVLLSGVLPI